MHDDGLAYVKEESWPTLYSKDGKTAAYSISEGGSDWRKIIVIDVESKKVKETINF